jgi:hypothetical protein
MEASTLRSATESHPHPTPPADTVITRPRVITVDCIFVIVRGATTPTHRLPTMPLTATDQPDRTSTTIDSLDRSSHESGWPHDAACREPNAPSMFADEWGVGRPGRRRRAAALAWCRRCPVRKECGLQALAEAR